MTNKHFRYFSILPLLFIVLTAFVPEESADSRKIYATRTLDIPLAKTWEILVEKYDEVENSHPKIVTADYVGNFSKPIEGAQRRVNFNAEKSKYMIEEIVSVNKSEGTILLNAIEVGELPVKPNVTKSLFKVEDAGNGKTKISCVMVYETIPAFLGGMIKGKLTTNMVNYFIAIEHYAKTGESVNRANFPRILEKYS